MSWLPWRTSHPVGRNKSAQSSEFLTSDSWPPSLRYTRHDLHRGSLPDVPLAPHRPDVPHLVRDCYLRCGDCGDMWTMRHHAEAEEKDDEAMHPRRRHTDYGLAV